MMADVIPWTPKPLSVPVSNWRRSLSRAVGSVKIQSSSSNIR